MSKEPPTAALPGLARDPPPPPLPPPHSPLVVPSAAATTAAAVGASASSSVAREYGRGNWTLQETLSLISAKKLDDERRILSSSSRNPSHGRTGDGEHRWKWIENYCYARGCLRSQNQCNDRWDNLLRDYKKVLEHESRAAQPHSSSSSHPHHPLTSYWNMHRHERRDHGLPANLSLEIFQKLDDVVHRPRTHLPSLSTPIPIPGDRPPPPPPVAAPAAVSEGSDSPETEDRSDKPGHTGRKRKKKRSVGSSIVRGVSVLARTLQRCEEEEEKRHRETMELEQRRLRMEEQRNEVSQQAIAAVASAVNTVSGAIQSLVPADSSHARN